MNPLFLFFITAIAANSFLNLGFGVHTLVKSDGGSVVRAFAPALAIIIAGIVVWPMFAFVFAPLSLGFLEPILIVPISVLISMLSNSIVRTIFAGKNTKDKIDTSESAISAYDGLTYAASFMFLRFSASFTDSILLAMGGAVGYLLCEFSLRAIRERSDTEPIPRCLRGIPLMLIAAGLMAILFSFLASAGFAAIGKRL